MAAIDVINDIQKLVDTANSIIDGRDATIDQLQDEITRLREDKARLLEALEAAANRIESIMETEPHLHLKDDLRMYRAAIDKARGK